MATKNNSRGIDAVTQFYEQIANSPSTVAEQSREDIRKNQVEFSVFCIENVAVKLGISGDEVYRLLTKDNDILDEYIIPNYEVLHTQDKEYIVSDIIDYMKECGVLK